MKETTITVKRLVNHHLCKIQMTNCKPATAVVPTETFGGMALPDIEHKCRVDDNFPNGNDTRIEVIESHVPFRRPITRSEAFNTLKKMAPFIKEPQTDIALSLGDFNCEDDIKLVYNEQVRNIVWLLYGKTLPRPAEPPGWLSVEDALEEMARTRVPMDERITVCASDKSAMKAIYIFCQRAATEKDFSTGGYRVFLIESDAWHWASKKLVGLKRTNHTVLGFFFTKK